MINKDCRITKDEVIREIVDYFGNNDHEFCYFLDELLYRAEFHFKVPGHLLPVLHKYMNDEYGYNYDV